jgi:hypothetical protein
MEEFWIYHVFRFPLLAVYVVAVVLAIQRWGRHREISLLCVIGFGICILSWFLNAFFLYVQMSGARNGISPERLGYFIATFGRAMPIVLAVATGMIVAAVFLQRPQGVGAEN